MKIICSILLVALLFGCKKKDKEDDPFVLNFQKLLEKYMVCDSIKTSVAGVSAVQVLGRDHGEDIVFHSSANFTTYSTPQRVQGFQLVSPNKLYYYDDILVNNQYYFVPTLTDSTLVLERTDSTNSVTRKYYRAE